MATLQETLEAFVQFVQSELFRRPFLNSDPNQESVMVRRGGGPRQLTGIALTDDQVLGQVNGVVTGIPFDELADLVNGSEKKLVHEQAVAAITWTITHSFNSTTAETYVVDETGERIYPDSAKATDASTVVITFTKAQAGTALIRWYD